MANKTYLPEITKRVINKENNSFGILNNDLDNCYKQRVIEFISASPTAKDCWDKRTSFYHGQGFENKAFASAIVNARRMTVAQLLCAAARDKAVFKCFGIHVNFNANFKVTSVNFVKDEDIRMGYVNKRFNGTYKIYRDWDRKTDSTIAKKDIIVLPTFSSDPEVIKQQVIEAGGWDKYKGSLFYFNPEVDDYALATCDSVLEDIETEAGLKIFANRSVTTGFMPSTIIFMKKRKEFKEELEGKEEDMPEEEIAVTTETAQNLAEFQGAENGLKVMLWEYEDEGQKPEVKSFEINSVDKLFEMTADSVESRIIKGWSIPKELINTNKTSGLSNGSEKKEAIIQFNDDTQSDRDELSAAFKEIFSNWYTPINPENNYNIIPIPANVVEDSLGKVSGNNINQLLVSDLPKAVKKSVLISIYQVPQEDAEEIVRHLVDKTPALPGPPTTIIPPQ